MANERGNPNWVKGAASPNPSGRPPKSDEVKRAEEMLAKLAPDAVEELARLMRDGEEKTRTTVALGIVKATIGELSRVASASGGSLLGAFAKMTREEILEVARSGK